MRNFRALLLNQGVTTIAAFGPQLIAMRTWGRAEFFDWTLTISLPGYLTLGDFGFGTATVNEITQLMGRGDKERAKVVYQSTWASVTAITLVLALLMFAVLPFFDPVHALNLLKTPRWEAQAVIAVFGVNALLSQQGTFILAGYQSEHCFDRYQHSQTIQKLLEMLVLLLGVSLPRHMVGLAVAVLGVRVLVYAFSTRDMWSRNNWLRPGFRHFNKETALAMLRPATFITVYSGATMLNIMGFAQAVARGSNSVVGGLLSNARTISRVSNQVVGSLGISTGAEFSRLYGGGHISQARELVMESTRRAFWVTVGFVPLMSLVGPPFYKFWTNGKEVDRLALTAMLVSAVANSLWSPLGSAMFSINRTVGISLAFLITNLAGCFAAYALVGSTGVTGAATVMLIVELVMVVLVMNLGMKVIDCTVGEFIRAATRWPKNMFRRGRAEPTAPNEP